MIPSSSTKTVQFRANQAALNAALKIPTVQMKKVIKLNLHKPSVTTTTPLGIICHQLDQQLDQKIPFSSVPGTPRQAPPILEKTCGLFDIDNPLDIETDKSDALDMENMNIPLDLHEPLTPVRKSFSEKINQANLKIKITKPDMNSYEPMDELNLDDVDLNSIMTPTTERMCMQYLHTIQTDEAQQLKSAFVSPVFNNTQILASYALVETDIDKLLALNTPNITTTENPFLSHQSGNVNFSAVSSEETSKPAVTSITYDHQYSAVSSSAAASIKRPRFSSSVFDDENSSNFSFDSSFAAANADSSLQSSQMSQSAYNALSAAKKKQRTRGIYRYDDVTTEEDYKNYLERRKKNNISSKVSRANKKNYYNEMDSRMNTLELENTQLEAKAKKLEQINQMMKDYLIQNFAKSSPAAGK